ncbi:MAG TPA: M48 family metallopeptidase [Longimicrobiales bacterium]|nr:M48 family metallopeptidase [Longimicrobiales bacterium]
MSALGNGGRRPGQPGKQERSAAVLKAAVRQWASRIRVTPRRVQVQRMTRKWASCSPAGVFFSQDLLRQETAFREVVIVHELLHLVIPNHGRLFRSLMKAYLPRWEEIAGARIARRPCVASDSHRNPHQGARRLGGAAGRQQREDEQAPAARGGVKADRGDRQLARLLMAPGGKGRARRLA